MKVIFSLVAKPIDKAVLPIFGLSIPSAQPVLSFTQRKENSITKETFDKRNAARLRQITFEILEKILS